MRLILAVLLMSVACAPVIVKREPLFDGDHVVESLTLPALPTSIDLSKFPGNDSTIAGVSKGDPTPFDGILMSEFRAARDGLYRASYVELRTILEADRAEWVAQRAVYEEQLTQAAQKIADLSPGWWGQHKGAVSFIGGFFLAAAGILVVTVVTH